MKDLETYLNEGFFKNVGVDHSERYYKNLSIVKDIETIINNTLVKSKKDDLHDCFRMVYDGFRELDYGVIVCIHYKPFKRSNDIIDLFHDAYSDTINKYKRIRSTSFEHIERIRNVSTNPNRYTIHTRPEISVADIVRTFEKEHCPNGVEISIEGIE